MKSKRINFIRWHEKQLYACFAWLISCLMCGFLFVSIIEVVGFNNEGVLQIATLIILYLVGLATIELFRRFWRRFSHAQYCASAATCRQCRSYGLFDMIPDTHPIYARCEKCGHQWVIE